MTSAQVRVIVLGSTGSIGTQTLEVIQHLNLLHARGEWSKRYEVVALAAGRNLELLHEQADRFGVHHLALGGLSSQGLSDRRHSFAKQLHNGQNCRAGADAALRLVQDVECDLVVAAIAGAAGLPATLRAVELGRNVALANKETLVAAGSLIVPAARKSGSRLLPIDSEHSALWQCLAGTAPAAPPCVDVSSVSRMVLTASGGPFRTWTREQLQTATPEQALQHPVWNMGQKVTVDSASLTNKAFEVIEAHWLFGLPMDQIEVVIHPQSTIHSLVEFADGSTIAQLGSPDMRGPIQYALAYPQRPAGLARRIDWQELRRLDFEPPDLNRFPALALGYLAIAKGGTSGAIFNAANEVAVEAFLAGRITFGRIGQLTARAMDSVPIRPLNSLGDCLEADAAARRFIAAELALNSP